MTERPPTFSVVVPTYGRPSLLREAVASVLDQTFGDFELIVVSDGGSDEVRRYLDDLADPRVRYAVNTRARGASGNRNSGVALARGTWVAFLDDDDLWRPDKLEVQDRSVRAAAPDVALFYGAYQLIDFVSGEVVREVSPGVEGWVFGALLERNFIRGPSTVVIRRDVLLELGGFDEAFTTAEDADLYLRVAKRHRVGYDDAVLARVRLGHGERLSGDHGRRLQGLERLWAKHRLELLRRPRVAHELRIRMMLQAAAARDWRALASGLPWVVGGGALAPRRTASTLTRVARRLRRRGANDGAVDGDVEERLA